jgi:hypothetical protein
MVDQGHDAPHSKDTALRIWLLVIGMLVVGMLGFSGHLERKNRVIREAATVQRLFDGVDSEMLVQSDLYAISRFLTRELDQREMAILRLTDKVALSCRLNRDGDFHAALVDVIDDKVTNWTWDEQTERPAALDALCSMMLSTVAAARND